MTRLLRLISSEIRYRKLNFSSSVCAVAAATALFVAFHTMTSAQERENAARDPRPGIQLAGDSSRNRYGPFFSSRDIPTKPWTNNRCTVWWNIPAFHTTIWWRRCSGQSNWKEKTALLTGISNEYAPPGHKKKPMIFSVSPGKVYVGFQVSQRLGLKQGDSLELGGRQFEVERTLTEAGTQEDIRISANLADVQAILNEPGRINEIKAIDCLCLTEDEKPVGNTEGRIGSRGPGRQGDYDQKHGRDAGPATPSGRTVFLPI